MKIKKAIVLCAGFGKRLRPLTKNTPKPLIKYKNKTLLEHSINFLVSLGVKHIVINTHYLHQKIKKFIKVKKFKCKLETVFEKKQILDTGGGVLNASKKINQQVFFVINPDTIWNKEYKKEFKKMDSIYNNKRKPIMLLVDKNKSLDKSFKGDFNINSSKKIIKGKKNNYIFTGAQILNKSCFKNHKIKPFSMNKIWDKLISENKIIPVISKKKFIHINNYKTYKKLMVN